MKLISVCSAFWNDVRGEIHFEEFDEYCSLFFPYPWLCGLRIEVIDFVDCPQSGGFVEYDSGGGNRICLV